MLIARDLTKTYGGTRVLDGVSAEFTTGSITALIGPNGCGKSTLLRALSLLDPPDTGKVTVDEDVFTFPLAKGRKIVGPWPRVTLVFQQLFLWPHLTIRQNIMLPLDVGNCADRIGRVDSLIRILDMSEYVDRYPNQVSLGQRQRAAIARALALEPKYLLLDEITSALDIEQVSTLLLHLKLLRDRGVGIILVTHLIGFAKQAADQILFMRSGKIEEAGGPEILTSPKSDYMLKFLSLHEVNAGLIERK